MAVIGANGAGKTTLLKTISGLLRPLEGTITFEDDVISSQNPDKIVAKGIVQVPEGRLLFPDMSYERTWKWVHISREIKMLVQSV